MKKGELNSRCGGGTVRRHVAGEKGAGRGLVGGAARGTGGEQITQCLESQNEESGRLEGRLEEF